MSWKVKEGYGRSFPITGLTFQVRKVRGGCWLPCRIIVSAPVPVSFLWTLDFGFGTSDLDLGLTIVVPRIIQDEGDSPGWTRPVMITAAEYLLKHSCMLDVGL